MQKNTSQLKVAILEQYLPMNIMTWNLPPSLISVFIFIFHPSEFDKQFDVQHKGAGVFMISR
jgi:hypothetical protein